MGNAYVSDILNVKMTRRTMADVIVSLLPLLAASVLISGMKVLLLVLVCIVSSLLSETVFNRIIRKENTVSDLTAVVTGLVLALSLNPSVRLYEGFVGSVIASVVVKGLFGGYGRNFANPANTAHLFIIEAFSSPESVATLLSSDVAETETVSLWNMFIGLGGREGMCVAAILAAWLYLALRRVIRWYMPLLFISPVFLLSFIASGSAVAALHEILSGGIVFAAVFLAGDYVTGPQSIPGRALFSVCAGILSFVIRRYGAPLEGEYFAVLIANIFSPVIERIADTVFGGGKKSGN